MWFVRCAAVTALLSIALLSLASCRSRTDHPVQVRLQHVDAAQAVFAWEQPPAPWRDVRLEIIDIDGAPVEGLGLKMHASRPGEEGERVLHVATVAGLEDAASYRALVTGEGAGRARRALSAPVSFATPLGTPGLLEFGFEESGDLRLEWQGGSFHEPSFRVESSADGGATWSLVDVVTGERAILPLTPDDAGRQYRLRAELVRPDESPAISPWAGPIEPVLSPVRFSKIDVDSEHDPYSPERPRTEVTFEWDTADHEPALYVLEWKHASSNQWKPVEGSPFAHYSDGTVITSLTDGHRYDFRVRREIRRETDDGTHVVAFTPWAVRERVLVPVNSPTMVNAIALTPTSVAVEWVDQSDSEAEYVISCMALPDGPVEPVGRVEANTERFVDETVPGPGTSYQYSVTVIDAEGLTRGTSFDSCDPVDTRHHDAALYRLTPETVVVRNGELDHRATVAEMNGPHAYVTAGIRGALRAPPTFRPDWTNLPLGQSWTARIFANGRLLEEETHTVVAMNHVGGGLYEPLFTARRTPGLHGVYDGGTLLFPTQATAVTFRVTVTGSLCTSGALGPVEVVAGAPAEIQ